MLTERRAADRLKMAKMVQKLAVDMGFEADIEEYPREQRVEIRAADARVGISFDGTLPYANDTYLTPWNTRLGSDAKFSAAFGRAVRAEVNPHHRRKCMGCADGIVRLMVELREALNCIRDGRAFEAVDELV